MLQAPTSQVGGSPWRNFCFASFATFKWHPDALIGKRYWTVRTKLLRPTVLGRSVIGMTELTSLRVSYDEQFNTLKILFAAEPALTWNSTTMFLLTSSRRTRR
jgi:hypothetical protein